MTTAERPQHSAGGVPDPFVVPGDIKTGQFINCTTHRVQLMRKGMPDLVLPPATTPAKVRMVKVGSFKGVDIMQRSEEVEGLPDKQLNTFYLVSRIVKDAVPDRMDVVVPTDLVRDSKGTVIGAKHVAL
jgi:hypothetical protein